MRSIAWCLVGGFVLLTIPTLLTGTATLDSFESLPLLTAVAVGFAVGTRAGADPQRTDALLRTATALVAVVVACAASFPPAQGLLISMAQHENILAAQVACVALIAYAWRHDRWTRLLFPSAAFLSALSLGSRSVAAAIVAVLVLDSLRSLALGRRSPRSAAMVAVVVVVALGTIVTVVPSWRAQVALTLGALRPTPGSPVANLIPASEAIGTWPWSLDGVVVTPAGLDGAGNAVATITKTSGSATARPQVRLELAPHATYTVALAVNATADRVPGLVVWAPAGMELAEVVLRAGVEADGTALVSSPASASLSLEVSEVHAGTGGWTDLTFLLRNLAEERRTVWLGPTPDVRPDTAGAAGRFTRLLAQAGRHEAPTYVATWPEQDSLRTARSRLRTFALALAGIPSAPWIGHGHGSYVRHQLAVSADGFAFAHAHDLALHVAFERGAVGLLGLALLVAGLLRPPTARWSAWDIAVIGVLLMNVTDMTFWNTGVALPLGLAYGLAIALANKGERIDATAGS